MKKCVSNKFVAFLIIITAQLFVSGCEVKSSISKTGSTSNAASLVLKNGAVYTMSEEGDVATAVAIDGDWIIHVGDDDTVEKYIGEGTKVVDLAGKMVVPGFVDGHTHPPNSQIEGRNHVILDHLEPDVDVYREAIREYAAANPDFDVIRGIGLRLNIFEGGAPTKALVDDIVNDKPVRIADSSGHGILLNSYALKMSGITKDTPNPPGGVIYKDPETGEPTGYLSDAFAAAHPDIRANPEVTKEIFMEAWAEYEDTSLPKGITAIHNAHSYLDALKIWPIMDELAKADKLRMRVNFLYVAGIGLSVHGTDVPGTAADKYIQGLNDAQKYVSDWQQISGVKIALDGVPEGKSAYLLEPYAETAGAAPDYRGTLYWDENVWREFFLKLDAAGYQMQAHAMGDGSARLIVDTVEAAQKQNGKRDARHTVVHANLIGPADIVRMGEMDIYAAVSPVWFFLDPVFSALELQMLGQERFDQEYSVRDMAEAGIHMTGSADHPASDDRPLFGIEAGVTQGNPYPEMQGDSRYIRDPSQTLSVMDMLRIYTINGAKQMFMDHLIGSLERDKKADMVILAEDITKIDPVDISETEIVATVVNGEVVYGTLQ